MDQQQAVATGDLTEPIEKAVEAVLTAHELPVEVEVSIVLVNDRRIHELNRAYRGVDRPTDVLSFGGEETDGGDTPSPVGAPNGGGDADEGEADEQAPVLLGDVVISMQRAADQAHEYGHSLAREAAYLAVHGLLHLLGYDHETEEGKAEMRLQEESALGALGISR